MKRVLVTGGNRGIGRAIVRSLAAKGDCRIVFSYRSREEEARSLCDELGDVVSCFQLDLLDAASIRSSISSLIAEGGGFDVVVHNAGMTADQNFYFMNDDQWTSVINASLNSFFHINKEALPHMIQRRWGRIVSLVSVSGESGNRGQANYAAAKAAIIGATKSLAKEVGSRGIMVNAVSPGLIATEMIKDVPVEEVKKLIPVGRVGTPEEVAHAVRFLVSEEASYICGEVIRVNGGLYT